MRKDVVAPEARIASESDVAALARLRYEWRVGEGGEPGLDPASFETALLRWMQERRLSHVPFLASRGDTPIGMTWLAIVERVPGPGRFVRRSAYIQSTYVVADERSAGVGTQLVSLALDHAGQLGLDYVAVHPSDLAFSLYRRLGFEDSGRVLGLRHAHHR